VSFHSENCVVLNKNHIRQVFHSALGRVDLVVGTSGQNLHCKLLLNMTLDLPQCCRAK